MAKHHRIFLLLGSNIEPRVEYLTGVKNLINKELGRIEMQSSVYESEPWGFDAELAFVNQVVQISTEHEPVSLLEKCQQIEKQLGRKEKSGTEYESRVIDIDILYFDESIITLKNLQIPHPQIQFRRFTLMPLAEVAPDFMHPGLKRTSQELLNECTDQGKVWKFKSGRLHEI
ncbi:MAG: 2-amino-4-hydroxy-6-hydroxymethyldihydropteridine diphosphokinase [Bacteroidales bacterium]|nr:2-amino-4-hydroxy-6-hydroxymethyldihydropteridine diphosphokinase [Bacteroidales bacterium]